MREANAAVWGRLPMRNALPCWTVCSGRGEAQAPKVWVISQRPLLRGALLGESQRGRQQRVSTDGVSEDGADLLVQIPVNVHLLLVVGTVVSSSPHGTAHEEQSLLPMVSFSHHPFTFCLISCLYLDQNKTVPLPPAPTARLCSPNGCPQGTSVCLNI